jgi:signal transduction histidine kinase
MSSNDLWMLGHHSAATDSAEAIAHMQKMATIGTHAAAIAHDFNNLLAAIIGYAEMALNDVAQMPATQHKMDQVLKAALRSLDLVKQILAYGRNAETTRKEVRLGSLLQETQALLRGTLLRPILVRVEIRTDADIVFADPTQVQQVLINLATNAAVSMRGGGLLTLGLSSVTFLQGSLLPDPEMHPGVYVKLTVKDTGRGMTAEVLKRIFEPFFTTKEQGEGTGLGLALVYAIVKRHGGGILVKSEGGQGSTFEVFLPQAVTRTF